MSIFAAIKALFVGAPVEPKPEQPAIAPVVSQPPAPPAPPAEVPAPVAEKKPRAPRKPKDDSWLKAEAASKRPATNKPQNVVGKQPAKITAKKTK